MSEIAKIQGYDIRDKKLADATSASSVASTDAIRMKTTTGDEVYIDRDSFVGAIASVFKANNSSDVTSLFGELTANNESSPCSINMSNLASVLSDKFPIIESKTGQISISDKIGILITEYDNKGNLYLIRGGNFNEVYKGASEVSVSKYSNYTIHIDFPANAYTLCALFIGGTLQ